MTHHYNYPLPTIKSSQKREATGMHFVMLLLLYTVFYSSSKIDSPTSSGSNLKYHDISMSHSPVVVSSFSIMSEVLLGASRHGIDILGPSSQRPLALLADETRWLSRFLFIATFYLLEPLVDWCINAGGSL
jgi:hypothetical protein